MALLSGELLSTDMLGEMQRTVTLPGGPGPGSLEYGLGLVELQGCSGPVWGHTGGVPGFTTYTFSSPDGRQQLTLSANEGLTAGNDVDVATAINDVLLTVFCGAATAQDAGPDVETAPLPDLGPLRVLSRGERPWGTWNGVVTWRVPACYSGDR